jgi:hypothetical protein
MTGYTLEVFKPEFSGPLRMAVFYTITADDVGHTVIRTTGGTIPFSALAGGVLQQDVGKRIYRLPDGTWQAENDTQRAGRLAGKTQS